MMAADLLYRVLWDLNKDLQIQTDTSLNDLGLVLKQKEAKR
jgi:hypothetical protein